MPRPTKKALEEKAKMAQQQQQQQAQQQAQQQQQQSMMGGMPVAAPPNLMPGTIAPSMVAQPPHMSMAPGVGLGVAPGPSGRFIDADAFLRVRDAAVGRLTMIADLMRALTNDYYRQSQMLLGENGGDGSHNELLTQLDNAAATGLMMPFQDLMPAQPEKKERKKRTHDPHAPKRPLTPYFLYMQHARSIIANDLGTEAPKGAVQEEGQRRWAHMGPHEKQGWNNAYQYNLRLYNARVASYKAGNPLAKNMSDEEALKYAEDYNVPMPEMKDAAAAAAAQADAAANDQDAIAEQLQQVAAAPVMETPKKGAAAGGRKRKGPESTPVPASDAGAASPDKKRRRSAKPAEEKEEPKKSGRKKTKSS